MQKLIISLAIFMAAHASASPTEAERIKRTFELSQEAAQLKLQIAKTDEERKAAWEKRPSFPDTAAEMWLKISPHLREDWSIPYAGFYLNLTHLSGASDQKIAKNRQLVLDTFEKNHLQKNKVGEFYIALAQTNSSRGLTILEKVIATNPDQKCRGIAALAAALHMKGLGEDPEVIKKRLTHLRTAIINAADEEIGGGKKVSDIASEEIFHITYLMKGRTPPEFSGTDVGGRIIRSADFKGKITILLFWNTGSAEINKVIELANKWVEKYTGKPVSMIGITQEPLAEVRKYQADETIRWNNIIDSKGEITALYRAQGGPFIYVLGADGKIEFMGSPGSFVELSVDALLAEKK